jgi:TolC family type I secretion outer membrane protein
MKNYINYFSILFIFIASSISAQEIVADNNAQKKKDVVNANTKLFKQKNIDIVSKKVKDKDNVSSKATKKLLEKFMAQSDIDISKYDKVTLKDAVYEAVSKSDNIKAQREKVIQAQLNYDDAVAGFYPTIDAKYEKIKTRTNPSGEDGIKYKRYTDESYKFTFKQNIFAGGQTQWNLKSVEQVLKLEKNKYRIVLQEEIAKAIKAYFDVVFNKKTVEVNERNMQLLEKILEIVTVKYESGAVSIGDLTSIKASVANAKGKLLKVKSKLAEALRYYEYIVGIQFSKTLPYEKDFDIQIGDFNELYNRALQNNPNLINYKYNMQAQKYKVKESQSKFMPRVDFEAGYETIQQADGQIGEVDNKTAGFKITYNLFNGGKDKNRVLRNYSNLRGLKYKLEEEKKKLKWNLSKLHTSVSTVKDVLQSTYSEVSSSRQMVKSYWEGFNLGEQDLATLLQGQRQLNSAEKDYVKFKSSIVKDFFTILGYTGDITSYFGLDPDNKKFIDFTNSTYMYNNKYSIDLDLPEKIDDLDIKDQTNSKKEDIQKIDDEEKVMINNDLLEFASKFKDARDDYYTILIKPFNTIYTAIDFAKLQNIQNEYLLFDKLNGYNHETNIAYGIFENKDISQTALDKLTKQDNLKYIIKPIKDVKKDYLAYLDGLKVVVKQPKPKVKIVKKIVNIVKIKKPVEYETDLEFKNQFLEANPSSYSINIGSFRTMKNAVEFAQNEQIYNDSFIFTYGDAKLVKMMYGIFDTYTYASDALKNLSNINKAYHPIIETVGLNQKLYNKNIELNIKEEPQYEFVNENKKTKNSKKIKKLIKKEIKNKDIDEIVQDDIIDSSKVVEPKLAKNIEEVAKKYDIKKEEKEDIIKKDKDFYAQFINAPKDYYTINLASLLSMQKVEIFQKQNKIEDKSIVANIDNKYFKIYYGVYKTRDEVLKAIENLDPKLKRNKPFIKKIYKVQELLSQKPKELKQDILVKKEINKIEKIEKLKIDEPIKKLEPVEITSNIKEEQKIFDTMFLSAPKDYYTINLASLSSIELAKKFIKLNKLENKSIAILTKNNYAFVYYGIYPTRDEAMKNYKNLPKKLLKNKPFLNKIKKAQNRYEVYMKPVLLGSL